MNEQEREQFTFFKSYKKAVDRIKNKATRCAAYDAITDYAIFGIEPDLDKLPEQAAIALEGILPNLKASRRKAEGAMRKDKSKIPGRYSEDNGKIP